MSPEPRRTWRCTIDRVSALSQTFLRRPATPGEVVADVVRLATILSVVVVTVSVGAVQFGVFMLALLGTLVPRALGVRASLDVLAGVSCLVAAWSNVFDLYTRVLGWDKVVHAVLTAALVALAVEIGRLAGVLSEAAPRGGLIVAATLIGLGLGGIWEALEWAGHTFVDPGVVVGYVDTIGDLGADGVGGLVAGFTLPFLIGSATRPGARASRRGPATRGEYAGTAAARGGRGASGEGLS